MSNRRRNHLAAFYPSTAYAASPANWFGDFMGNLGNSWQGGEDAPMYGGNPRGDPYATTTGAYVAGQATADAAKDVVAAIGAPITGFLSGMLRGTGVIVGLGIVAVVLINAHSQK